MQFLSRELMKIVIKLRQLKSHQQNSRMRHTNVNRETILGTSVIEKLTPCFKKESRKQTNPFSAIPSISFWSVPAIVFRRLPRGFLERERRLTESVLLLSFASSSACKPLWTCCRDFLAADWRSKRFPLVSTFIIWTGYLKMEFSALKIKFEVRKAVNYFEANIRHCSSGDGNRWSSGTSFSSSDLLLTLPLTIVASSVQSWEVLGRIETIVWSAFDVLWETLDRQSGATVTSPIASFEVHFLSSSTAAG